MNWKFFNKKPQTKPRSALREWREAIIFAVVVATLIRWGTVEAFVIPTPSMENSLLVGDYLAVSKIHYGPRTPRTPLQIPLTHQKIWGTEIPSYLNWIELPSFRLPGISSVKREDVVVFNVPTVSMNEGKVHPIDLKTYYVKRCVGIPGDTLMLRSRDVIVNGKLLARPDNMKVSYLVTTRDVIRERAFSKFDLDPDDYYYLGKDKMGHGIYKMLLTDLQAQQLKGAPFLIEISDDYTTHDGPDEDIFPLTMNKKWNGDNYGPLVIPKEGMTIIVNDSTLGLYGEAIKQYEHHKDVKVGKDALEIDGSPRKEYTFRQDYYFMVGDSRNNSLDSRYWGFVPADHIVGKPLFIWMSIDEHAGAINKIRWKRLFKAIR